MRNIKQAVVIGTGNWGSVLAKLIARNVPVRMWAENDQLRAQAAERLSRGNGQSNISVQTKFTGGLDEEKTLIVMAVPSSAVRSVAEELGQRCVRPLILSVSKGFDSESFCTPSQLISSVIPGAVVVSLTGPTIANEVAQDLPTVAVLSSDHLAALAMVKTVMKNEVVRFATGRNPNHHELCAAMKGIVAIGVGMAEGLELGINFQAVIITMGISEMARVASFFDIPMEVVYGLSGVGDTITTCLSHDSRNRRLGVLLGKGRNLEAALKEVKMTVEGVAMSKTIETLWSLDVSIPLIHFINSAVFGRVRDIRTGFMSLVKGSVIQG